METSGNSARVVKLWRGAKGQERTAGRSQILKALDRAKTSETSRKAKVKEDAKKPIRSLAQSSRNSEDLADLMRGEFSLVTRGTSHTGEAQTSEAGNGARGEQAILPLVFFDPQDFLLFA
jgi:hypothetical protein